MKVGIVTFHWAYNYGAVLQAYALQQEILQMGFEVEFINYNPFSAQKGNKFNVKLGITDGSLVRKINKVIRKIKNYQLYRKYGREFFRSFDQFRADFLKISSSDDLSLADYDAVVVGSDQVWNASWIGDAIFYYYLEDFRNVKKISYAACVGNDCQPVQYTDKIKQLLGDFSSVSVRNKFSCDYVKLVSGDRAEMVCDPTLLNDFDSLSVPDPKISDLPDKFILVYALDQPLEKLGVQVVRQMKEKLQLPVVSISSVFHTGWTFKYADHIIYNATPIQWLWLFKNAAFVCTDSFHGVVFSLKNRKPVLGYRDEGWRSFRLTDLMANYRIDGRLLSTYNEGVVNDILKSDIDYDYIFDKINSEVKKSALFLKNALSD